MNRRRAHSTGKWVVFSALAIGLIAGVGFLAWRWFRPSVNVTEVIEGPVVQAFYSTGTIAPEREFPIKANIEGILAEVHVDKGDAVTEGQVLALVFDGGLQFMVDKAQAELNEKLKLADPNTSPVLMEYDSRLEATSELLAIAQREQRRVADIVATGGANQTDLDQAIDRFQRLWSEAESIKAQKAAKQLELQREVEVAKSALSIAEWDQDEQMLKSPIDGVVLDRPASRGTRMAINGHVMNIADVRPANLVMRAAVDEEDIAGVIEGQAVKMTLYAFPNRTFSGSVRKIYDQADESRRTFEVDVTIDAKGDRLAPGMTGELAFILAEKEKALVIPSQAVMGNVIWVVRDNRLVRLTPELGIRSIERTEVISGLVPGDRIVIDPVAGFKDRQTVATTFVNPADAAGLNRVEVEEQPFKAFD